VSVVRHMSIEAADIALSLLPIRILASFLAGGLAMQCQLLLTTSSVSAGYEVILKR
jgi:hypothetical protein